MNNTSVFKMDPVLMGSVSVEKTLMLKDHQAMLAVVENITEEAGQRLIDELSFKYAEYFEGLTWDYENPKCVLTRPYTMTHGHMKDKVFSQIIFFAPEGKKLDLAKNQSMTWILVLDHQTRQIIEIDEPNIEKFRAPN